MVNPVIILPRGAAGNISGEFSISGLRNGGQITLITLSDSAWTRMARSATTDPTGTGPLVDRNAICIQNQSDGEVKLQYDNTTVGYKGILIPKGAERHYDITEDIDVYLKAAPGTTPLIALEEIS